jgi:hypothetical protein
MDVAGLDYEKDANGCTMDNFRKGLHSQARAGAKTGSAVILDKS